MIILKSYQYIQLDIDFDIFFVFLRTILKENIDNVFDCLSNNLLKGENSYNSININRLYFQFILL